MSEVHPNVGAAPISPTFDPRPIPGDHLVIGRVAARNHREIAAAAEHLQASVRRLRHLTLQLADELAYTAEAIGAIRTIIGGGR